MCGVVGIVSSEPVNQFLYNALTVMQHRGQDAAGIVTWGEEQGLKKRKGNGLVRDVFHNRHMTDMRGTSGIGHVRYPTAGGSKSAEAQPFYVNSPYGICLAHNGNLTNYDELAELLIRDDRRHLSTNSDSEVLLNVLAHELQMRVNGNPTAENVFDAIDALHKRCKGGYAVVALIVGFGVVAFRDPNGIRPLVLGEREEYGRKDYMVASESVALDVLQFSRLRDVRPGECIVIENNGSLHCHDYPGPTAHTPCIFEYVYFARPDSIMDELSVYKARLRMGEQLAGKIVRSFQDHDIDVVIPIPDTSRTSALQVAYHLGVKYREGFIKNRYIGRTFIMPGQEERKKSVRQKLNAITLEFHNKNVLLVDDSIVRGTTSKQIIKLARDAGARKVYFASAAPPVRYPNVYGIDMPAASELIANGRTVEEIQEIIGADRLIYQDLNGLIRSVRHGNSGITEFDTSCFSGEYVTGDVTDEYLCELEKRRNDAAKQKRETLYDKESNVVAL
ncbi:MAG: amidophosphoribosyltransferase [Gammaproteobacteria bacterium]|jgi:amidophosphoribosyltransferase|nr:amidophosphoribosyltransferase [Gammaproteobacteria bacterium]